jgi:hypothetical protein
MMLDPAGLSYVEVPVQRTTSKASALNLRTRAVCRDCNTGWMSRLEQRSEPLITAMAAAAEVGEPVILTRDDARLVARWAQKTAITNEMTSVYPKVATTEMGQRLRHGQPLRASQVWAARHPADYLLSLGLAHLLIGGTPRPTRYEECRHALLTSITYHYITLFVLISDGQVLPPSMDLAKWSLLWPCSGDVSFPPALAVTGAEVTRRIADQRDWLPFSDTGRAWRLYG